MKARRFTERDLVRREVKSCEGWLVRYANIGIPDVVTRVRKVSEMDPETASAADLKAVGHLVGCRCNGCNDYVLEGVEVGDEADYESATATLCRKCVVEALEAIDGEPSNA